MALETTDLFKQTLSRAKGLHHMTDEEVKKVQKVVYSITKDVAEICEENDIPYMLSGGTALGAVRHGGFIPWDDDIDLNIYRKDIDRLADLIEEKYPDKYYVVVPLRTPGYYSSFVQVQLKGTTFREYLWQEDGKCGIKIDLWILENDYDNPIKRRFQGLLCDGGSFILSCIRMHREKKEVLSLAEGNKKGQRLIKIKSAIGALPSLSRWWWYRRVQHWFSMCHDEHSKYISIPGGRKHFFGEMYERAKFSDTVKMKFEDSYFPVTKDYDHYFHVLYPGDYMQLPPPEKREEHVLYELKFKDD
ncbi:MAG: hypothetical protein DUD27_00345 [Lachnospiraceae bacterium]|uniref:LicD family protein n=1 Tax=Candidatus Weimeria bifida TaxID=2599074 RepID=A0A6N7J0Y8_9FIRM|nr:LicD family protein [Candidatus Weimeria bifida]RRF97357.1 MAG: hypothetical protein DUD27_00345 [Lachnospiraceae bacterium]